MDSKSDLRIKAKSIRRNLDLTKKSHDAVNQIRQLDEYKSAKHVMIYYPLKYELNLLSLLQDDKHFYLPKVQGNNILVCPYSDKLALSDFKTFEPCTNPINPKFLDLIIVPALMADTNNYRLGYGGGFYDRFLASYSNIKTVVAVVKELFVQNLPIESFDRPINTVIKV